MKSTMTQSLEGWLTTRSGTFSQTPARSELVLNSLVPVLFTSVVAGSRYLPPPDHIAYLPYSSPVYRPARQGVGGSRSRSSRSRNRSRSSSRSRSRSSSRNRIKTVLQVLWEGRYAGLCSGSSEGGDQGGAGLCQASGYGQILLLPRLSSPLLNMLLLFMFQHTLLLCSGFLQTLIDA